MLSRRTCLITYPWFYSWNVFLANTAFFRINTNIRLLLGMSKQISFPQWCSERCNYFAFLYVRKHYWDWGIPTFFPLAWEPSGLQRSSLMQKHGHLELQHPPLLPLMRIACWDPKRPLSSEKRQGMAGGDQTISICWKWVIFPGLIVHLLRELSFHMFHHKWNECAT